MGILIFGVRTRVALKFVGIGIYKGLLEVVFLLNREEGIEPRDTTFVTDAWPLWVHSA